jgi:nitrate/TMAO reductase-like tetraheme cytochrome c subunit
LAGEDGLMAKKGKQSLKERVVHLKMKLTNKVFAFVCSRNAFIATMILILLIIGSAAGIAFTCRPQFCGFCHEMDPQISSWKVSTHRNVNCIACHVEPGLIPLLIDKVKAVKSPYYKIFGGYEKPINHSSRLAGHMHEESCLQCHSRIKEVTPSHGRKIDHEAHEKINLHCTECHNRLAHQIEGYEDHMEMNFCLDECHDGVVIKNDCEVCHTDSFLEDNKEPPQSTSEEEHEEEHEEEPEEEPEEEIGEDSH